MAKARNPRDAKKSKTGPKDKSASKRPARKEPARKGTAPARTAARGKRPAKAAAGTPLERAQDLIDRAFVVPDPEEALDLAEQALLLSRDCADAYTLLADFAADSQQALSLSAEAVAAAERSLDSSVIEQHAGHLWSKVEARPYLRARLGLAQRLWWTENRDESIAHLREMLELNLADNQGVRYILASRLAEMGHDDELQKLLNQFDEQSTFWMFTKALAAFRHDGDTIATRALLSQARAANKHVIPLLLSGEELEEEMIPVTARGTRSEAEVYRSDFIGGWRQTPGAITWLRKVEVEAARAASPKNRKVVGPTAAVKKRLLKVNQQFGTEWQASIDRLPTWVEEYGHPVRPWSMLVVDHSEHLIIGQEMVASEPTSAQMFDHIVHSIEKPLIGKPHRPSEIQVLETPLWEEIRPHLQEIGIDCIYRTELDELTYIRDEMGRMFLKEQQFPPLIEIPRIDPARIGGLYAAASEYYKAAPWRVFGSESPIRIECAQIKSHRAAPWYALAMGQSNMTFGLALYAELEMIHSLWRDHDHDHDDGHCDLEQCEAAPINSLSLMFSEAFEISVPDLVACEGGGWPLAGPEAYPLLIAVQGADSVRPLEPWEVLLMEGALRALPKFAGHQLGNELIEEKISVPTSGGNLDFTLTWSPEFGNVDEGCGDECDHDHGYGHHHH